MNLTHSGASELAQLMEGVKQHPLLVPLCIFKTVDGVGCCLS